MIRPPYWRLSVATPHQFAERPQPIWIALHLPWRAVFLSGIVGGSLLTRLVLGPSVEWLIYLQVLTLLGTVVFLARCRRRPHRATALLVEKWNTVCLQLELRRDEQEAIGRQLDALGTQPPKLPAEQLQALPRHRATPPSLN
jgi:hypothetical protein